MQKLENWDRTVISLAELAYKDERSAQKMAETLVEPATEYFGYYSKELLTLKHQQGIINMLIENYEKAESCFLEALDIAESIKSLMDSTIIVKQLKVLYEAKARSGH